MARLLDLFRMLSSLMCLKNANAEIANHNRCRLNPKSLFMFNLLHVFVNPAKGVRKHMAFSQPHGMLRKYFEKMPSYQRK